MSCVTNPIVNKPLSMANAATCLFSLPPSLFTPNTSSSYPYLSSPFKPNIKFQLSCSHSSSINTYSSFFLKNKSRFPPTVAFVASQQVVEDEDEDEEEEVISETEVEEEDAGEISEDAKLFVGNLSFNVDSENLAELFQKAGIVEISEVIYNRETEQSRGFAFVTMSTVEEAEKAEELFNGYELNGRPLTVNKASARGSRPERTPRTSEPGNKIYIGNLPWEVDDSRLVQLFSEHGKVVNARVVCDRESGRSRGFGFVTMSTESEVNDAIANLDGQSMGGRALRVNVAQERERRSF
ncbi:hypothetical protein LguiB_022703 [Lonicera macranthoides]